ncbi:Enolase-phosphatase E1 [Cyphellophora attinorum]|uniref:Enolase-phosphatase E1 n=1 Tax=Cyphellophora attinorum TaxID=1664694 RepID=A0A0N0NMS6_9EURO|nr:Enolase-phosphatase E1 [Phialophora attinorum]KPI40801.1 Enolase-phosphatase E1 [Phialophora attinorum]
MVSTRSTKRAANPAGLDGASSPEKKVKQSQALQSAPQSDLHNIKVVLLDIGKPTGGAKSDPTQFPYALKALPLVLETQWDSPNFAPYRDAFPAEHRASPAALEAHVKDLTERDVKIAYLKNLQGYLWEDGYKTGAYSTPLYQDVLDFFDRWPSKTSSTNGDPAQANEKSAGPNMSEAGQASVDKDVKANGVTTPEATSDSLRQIAIYSSGSVFAQKLLFAHVQTPSEASTKTGSETALAKSNSPTRDLNPSVTTYYDTTNAGLKSSASSYSTIAKDLDVQPAQILFLSDVPAEIDAAIEAGMRAIVVEREGNKPLSEEERGRYRIVQSLQHLGL